MLLRPAALETNYRLKDVGWKRDKSEQAKYCGVANEVAGKARPGNPHLCHSLQLRETVEVCNETGTFYCPRSNSSQNLHRLHFKPQLRTRYERVGQPGRCKNRLLIMAKFSRICLKWTARGTVQNLYI